MLASRITEQACDRAMSVREIVRATLDAQRCVDCVSYDAKLHTCTGVLGNQLVEHDAWGCCRFEMK